MDDLPASHSYPYDARVSVPKRASGRIRFRLESHVGKRRRLVLFSGIKRNRHGFQRRGHRSRPLPGLPVDLAKDPNGLTWVLISENGDSVLTRLNADGSSSGFPIGVNAEPILLAGKDRYLWMVVGTVHADYAVRIDHRGTATRFRFGKGHQFLEPPASVGPGRANLAGRCAEFDAFDHRQNRSERRFDRLRRSGRQISVL